MISDRKRRRAATYQAGFDDAMARCIEAISNHAAANGSTEPADLIARLREISVEADR